MLRSAFVALQAFTFVGLALILFHEDAPKLAGAQLCLALVTLLVYL